MQKHDTNDYENYDLDLRLNLALPFAYISIGNLVSLNEYSTIDSRHKFTTFKIRFDKYFRYNDYQGNW